MKTADFVQEKSEEIELSLSDAIRVTGWRVGNNFDGPIWGPIFCVDFWNHQITGKITVIFLMPAKWPDIWQQM